MILEPFNEAELATVMNNLKNKTSTGPYGISNKLTAIAAPAIVAPLNTLINRCSSESYFPDILKLAKVIPVDKNNDPNNFSNYRPISLVSPIGKLVEIVLYNRMINYINKFDLLHPNQFGFRKKHKTVDALACVIKLVRLAIDDKKRACCIFLDLSKAFDSIHHDILLSILFNYGFRGPVHHLLKSYLTNRSQFVQIDSCRSELKPVIGGVPQGSVVGPIMFILYANDLPDFFVQSNITMFADDTNLYQEFPSFDLMHFKETICKIEHWMNGNKLKCNVDKSKALVFASKVPTDLSFGELNIKILTSLNYLGYHIGQSSLVQ